MDPVKSHSLSPFGRPSIGERLKKAARNVVRGAKGEALLDRKVAAAEIVAYATPKHPTCNGRGFFVVRGAGPRLCGCALGRFLRKNDGIVSRDEKSGAIYWVAGKAPPAPIDDPGRAERDANNARIAAVREGRLAARVGRRLARVNAGTATRADRRRAARDLAAGRATLGVAS